MDRSHHSLPRYSVLNPANGQSFRQTLPAPRRAPGSQMSTTTGKPTQRWQQVVAPPPAVFDTLTSSSRSLTPFAPPPPASILDPTHPTSVPARATSPVAALDARDAGYAYYAPQVSSGLGGSTSSRGRGFVASQARSSSGPHQHQHQHPQQLSSARAWLAAPPEHPQGLFIPSSTALPEATKGLGGAANGAGTHSYNQAQEAEDTGLQALQLLHRVESLYSKADALLKQHGRCPTRESTKNSSDRNDDSSGSARFPQSHSASRFALLSDKLASLEDLLDDLAQSSLTPAAAGHPAMPPGEHHLLQQTAVAPTAVVRPLFGEGACGAKKSSASTPRSPATQNTGAGAGAAPQFHRLPSPSPLLTTGAAPTAAAPADQQNAMTALRAPTTKAAQAQDARTGTAPTSASTTPPHSGGLISVRVVSSSNGASSRSSSVRVSGSGGQATSAPHRANDVMATTSRSREIETARGPAMPSGYQSAPAPAAFPPSGWYVADRQPTPPRRFVEVGHGWPAGARVVTPRPVDQAHPQGHATPSTSSYSTGATPRQQVPRSAFLHYASWTNAQSGLSQSVPRVRSVTPSATFARPSAVVRTQSGSVTPISGCGTPRQGAPPLGAFQHHLQEGLHQRQPSPRIAQGPSRAFSAPWTSRAAPPPLTVASTSTSTAATLQKAAAPAAKDNAEAKIREWLTTISIGNGAHRGWDDTQILDIAKFAEAHKLEQLKAEDIYRRYVEYQVEKASQEAETTPSQTHRKESRDAGGGGEASDSDDNDDDEDEKEGRKSW